MNHIVGGRGRRYVRAGLSGAAARVLSALALAVSTAMLVSLLSTSDFGRYAAASALLIVGGASDFGVGSLLISRLSRAAMTERVSILSTALWASVFVSSLLCLFAVLLVVLLYLLDSDWALALGAVAVAVALMPVCGLGARKQIADEQGTVVAAWSLGASLLPQMAAVAFAWSSQDWRWAVVAQSVALIGMMTAQTFSALPISSVVTAGRPPAVVIYLFVKDAKGFFGLSFIAIASFNLDSIIVAISLGAGAAAEFAVAFRAFGFVNIVLQAALMQLWPATARALESGDKVWVRKAMLRSVVVAAVAALAFLTLLAICKDAVFRVWVGQDLIPSGQLVAASILWFGWISIWQPMSLLLNALQLQDSQFRAALFMVSVNVPLSFLLARLLGTGGPLLASFTAHFCANALLLWAVRKRVIESVSD